MADDKPVTLTDGSVDPNVRIPPHVQAQTAAADALHKQVYPDDPNPADPLPQPDTARVDPPLQPDPPPAPVAAEVQHPDDGFTAPADAQALHDSEWARRYNSMRGRYDALLRTNGAMEQQMTQLGQELVRTQNLVSQLQQAPPQAQAQPGNHNNLITDEDRASYGDELIDMATRAARGAVAPELEELRNENKRLTQRVQNTGKRELFATLDREVPTWRALNNAVQFKAWLRLPNIYTGALRGNMLKAAVDGAEAPKVISLFKDFLAEAAATGQQVPQAQQIEQQAPAAVPHVAALALDTLAAPGRARPASGDTQVPADKPIYTRDQISRFYSDSRKGLYAGREAEYRAIEADLQKAQGEGRIR